MVFSRARIGIGVVTVGMAMALVPAASSSAAIHSTKGTNPGSTLCKLEKTEAASESKSSASLEKAIEAGNWTKAKKEMLSDFGEGTAIEKKATAALAGAPSNVKSAASLSLKFASTEKGIIEKSTSEAEFETAFEKAAENKKLEAAEQTLSTYQTKICGSTTTTT
jgi:hypothetical protein